MINDDDYEIWATKCLYFNVLMNVLMFLMLLHKYTLMLNEDVIVRCYKIFKGIWQRFSNIVHGFAYQIDGSPIFSNIL